MWLRSDRLCVPAPGAQFVADARKAPARLPVDYSQSRLAALVAAIRPTLVPFPKLVALFIVHVTSVQSLAGPKDGARGRGLGCYALARARALVLRSSSR